MKNVVLWNSFVVGGLFSFVKKINVMQIFEFYRKQVKEKEERVSEGLVDISVYLNLQQFVQFLV